MNRRSSLCVSVFHILCGILLTVNVSGFHLASNISKRKLSCHISFSTLSTHLYSSSEDEDTTNYEEEEKLLQIHMAVLPDVPSEQALYRVSKYCQSFPFAAVLPVQPLSYLPTPDGGVDVRFLRKKTKEKGSLDGGIRFFVSENRSGIDVTAKRNSEGQTVPKIFSEKLVVQAFVEGICGEASDKTSPAPIDVVAVESVFHKWL